MGRPLSMAYVDLTPVSPGHNDPKTPTDVPRSQRAGCEPEKEKDAESRSQHAHRSIDKSITHL